MPSPASGTQSGTQPGAQPGDSSGTCEGTLPSHTPGHIAGWNLVRHTLLDSTNSEAQRLLAAGCPDKTIILADSQSAGKGRGPERVWESSGPQGLWASGILAVPLPAEQLAQSTLVLAVAVREAVERCTGVRLACKWPNDLMSGGRKCCGMLVETGMAHGGAPHGSVPLVLGIGLNINQTAEQFPPALRGIATSLRLLSGVEHCRMRLLAELAAGIASCFTLWAAQGFAPLREAWLAGNCTIGRNLILPQGYGCTQGTAHDLAPDGALLVRTATGRTLRVDSGEVLFHAVPETDNPTHAAV